MLIYSPSFAGTRAQRQGTLFLDSLDSTSRANCLLAASTCRRLNSQYYGPLIRVVESGSNNEQNIDSIGINQELDQASILTHVGSNDGSVKRLYDQSGIGNDFVQTTISKQPKIAEAGVIVTESGKPALSFDGIDDILASIVALSIDAQCLIILIGKTTKDESVVVEQSVNYNNNDGLLLYIEEGGVYISRSGTKEAAVIPGGPGRPWGQGAATILSLLSYGSSIEARNKLTISSSGTLTVSGAAVDIVYFGGRDGINHAEGLYQEIYVFNNDNNSQFTSIINSLNSYFGY